MGNMAVSKWREVLRQQTGKVVFFSLLPLHSAMWPHLRKNKLLLLVMAKWGGRGVYAAKKHWRIRGSPPYFPGNPFRLSLHVEFIAAFSFFKKCDYTGECQMCTHTCMKREDKLGLTLFFPLHPNQESPSGKWKVFSSFYFFLLFFCWWRSNVRVLHTPKKKERGWKGERRRGRRRRKGNTINNQSFLNYEM